tara:strand:- start:1083 stop:1205 length:123 start_codon:yes stop_codon:yes gene_type:complete
MFFEFFKNYKKIGEKKITAKSWAKSWVGDFQKKSDESDEN